MSTESLPFVSDKGTISSDLILPEVLREELGRPFGPVVREDNIKEYLAGCGRILAVGDIVTSTLIELGKIPNIMIFDCRTRRGPYDEINEIVRNINGLEITVDNPPGRLTAELWNVIARSLNLNERTKIRVNGEEDLASLACLGLGSIGDCVIYGIPDEGMTIINIDSSIKKKIGDLLIQMKPEQQE